MLRHARRRIAPVALAGAIAALGCVGAAPLAPAPPIRPPAPWTPGQGDPTAVQRWAQAMQPAPVVEFFRGLFLRAGVEVRDTGEAFTVIHEGDRILFSDELDPNSVDFVVEIESDQVDGLLEAMRAGELDAAARFRIMQLVSTPATRAMLRRPVIQSETVRSFLYWLGDAKERIHVVLVAPTSEQRDAAHTIVRRGVHSDVIAGLDGEADEVYRLSVDDAVDFQRRMMAARAANSLWTWVEFARWYGEFTDRVRVADAEASAP